jgi:two-component system, LuxR family, sensor kinase FixL
MRQCNKRVLYPGRLLFLLNRSRPLAYVTLFWVAWYAAACGRLEAISTQKKTVFILYGDRLAIPAIKSTGQGLMAGLSRGRLEDLEISSEYLDLTRLPAARYEDDIVHDLRIRYAGRKPDVVIAVGSSALQFAVAHRDELFRGAPIVFSNVDLHEIDSQKMPPNVTGVWMAWDFERTIELALQLQPETQEIVCVGGSGPQEEQWNNEARKVLEHFATRVRIRWLDKLSLPAVLHEVAGLPLDSVVLYVPMRRDGEGNSVSPFEVARQLAEVSGVPVYGLSRSELDEGIIGGALLDFSDMGQKTAALAFQVLAGQTPLVVTSPDPASNRLFINWQALKKWHVSAGRIPGAATVRYRGPGLWERHRRLIITTASILGLQSLLIIWLLVQRSRRKRVERSLRESEERMSLAAEAANMGMWVWDVGRDKLWMSDKGRALFGIEPGAHLDSATLVSRVHPEDRAIHTTEQKRAIENAGEYAMEYRVLLPDGTQRWIGARGHCMNGGDNGHTRLVGISMDVTAQKQAQDALRESEARFRGMADAAPVMIWMSGTDKLCTFFNKGWFDFTGRRLEQELGNGWAAGVHREDFDHCLEVYVNSFDARQPFMMEYRLRRRDGEYRWVLDNGAPRFASDGRFLGYIGSCLDITDRKQAQERFRLAVEASPNGIVLVNAQGHIVLANACVEKLFGYRQQELIGKAVELLVPERFHGKHLAHRADFHATPASRPMGAGQELYARRKDGTEFPVEIGISPIQSPEGTLVLSVIVDITERKQAEAEARQHREQVAHLSRLAIMGEMAGSLAHELNQPLGAIVTNVGAALRFLERDNLSGEKLREILQDIAADGKRAGDVIRTVKGIGRKEAGARRLLQLNEVITEVLRLVRSDAVAHDCTVLTELHPAPPKVEANLVQLQEVFLNLILNAFEASKDLPKVRRRVIIRTEPDGDSAVRASVRDFGTGLPADLPERVFDRFFSTKREGMGIGLFIARSIVAAHGGTLFAQNAEGGGAQFCLRLPAAEETGV